MASNAKLMEQLISIMKANANKSANFINNNDNNKLDILPGILIKVLNSKLGFMELCKSPL